MTTVNGSMLDNSNNWIVLSVFSRFEYERMDERTFGCLLGWLINNYMAEWLGGLMVECCDGRRVGWLYRIMVGL